jgi:RimJ/RimL family protein N-acetyltransferase
VPTSEGPHPAEEAGRDRIELGIEADGQLVGVIQTYEPPDRHLPEGTFEIGVGIADPTMRSAGIGTQAVRLFVEHLREHEGARRVQAVTELNNEAMRRVLDKLGFLPVAQVTVGELEETVFALDL